MSSSHLGVLVRGAGVVFVGLLFARAARYGINLIVARMGAETWGSVSLGLAMLEILSVLACLGLLSGVVRYVASFQAEQDTARVRGTVLSGVAIAGVTGTAVGLALWAAAPIVAVHLFHDARLEPVLQVIALLIPLNAVYQVMIKALLGGQAIAYYVGIWRIADNAVKLVVVGVLFAAGWGVQGVLAAWASSSVVCLLLATWGVNRKVIRLASRRPATVYPLERLLRYSLPLLLSGFIGVFSGWIDTLTLGHFCSTTVVGIYASALMLSSAITLGPDLLYPMLLPLMTERYAQQRRADLEAVYHTATRWIVWTVFPAAVFVAVFGTLVLTELFGAEYGEGAQPASVLVLGRLVYTASWTRATMIVLAEKTRHILGMTAVVCASNGILNVALIPRFGILGAASATACSLALYGVLIHVVARRIGPIESATGAGLPGWWRVGTAAGMAALAGTVVERSMDRGVVSLVVCMCAFGAVYVASLRLVRAFTAEDAYVLHAVCRRLGIRRPGDPDADQTQE